MTRDTSTEAPAVSQVRSGRAVVTTASEGRTFRISVQGELDIVSAPDLANAYALAQRHDAEDIVIDLRMCVFIDSRGLAALLGIHRCLADHGELRIVPGSRQVRRVFEISGLDAVLPISDA